MYSKSNEESMSELEREFELEMDDDLELEMDDLEFESFETDEDPEYENYEDESEGEFEWLETNDSDYAERFFELSQREFESESEIDKAVNEILDDMENEFFSFGGLWKKAKNAAKSLAKKGVALAKKAGINIPSIDALKSMLGPALNFLKGDLGNLIGPAIKAAIGANPAGAAALQALGFESVEDMGENREAWNNYVSVAKEAFENLAETINENADDPLEASRLATNAFQKALKNSKGLRRTRDHRRRRNFRTYRRDSETSGNENVRRIYLAPGEAILIKRKR